VWFIPLSRRNACRGKASFPPPAKVLASRRQTPPVPSLFPFFWGSARPGKRTSPLKHSKASIALLLFLRKRCVLSPFFLFFSELVSILLFSYPTLSFPEVRNQESTFSCARYENEIFRSPLLFSRGIAGRRIFLLLNRFFLPRKNGLDFFSGGRGTSGIPSFLPLFFSFPSPPLTTLMSGCGAIPLPRASLSEGLGKLSALSLGL